jgi:hypothetical protein
MTTMQQIKYLTLELAMAQAQAALHSGDALQHAKDQLKVAEIEKQLLAAKHKEEEEFDRAQEEFEREAERAERKRHSTPGHLTAAQQVGAYAGILPSSNEKSMLDEMRKTNGLLAAIHTSQQSIRRHDMKV